MLSNDQADKVRLTLQTSGWREIMLPVIKERGRVAVRSLCQAKEKRTGDFADLGDDVLRGVILQCEWLMEFFDAHLQVNEFNRRRDELDRQGAGPGEPGSG